MTTLTTSNQPKQKHQDKKRFWFTFDFLRGNFSTEQNGHTDDDVDNDVDRFEPGSRLGLGDDVGRGSDDDEPEVLDDGEHVAAGCGFAQRHQHAEHHPRR